MPANRPPVEIVIRADASVAIGTGHWRRCLSLAHALVEAGGAVRWVVRDLGTAPAILREAGFPVVVLPAPAAGGEAIADAPAHAGWAGVAASRDAAEVVAALRDAAPAWLVVDHYAFDAAWHVAVRAGLGCRIAAIDDLGDRPLAVDLLIDHNPAPDHDRKYAASGDAIGRLLGGSRFALVDGIYRDAAPRPPSPDVGSIGVFMGGADAGDVSSLVLAAIRRGTRFAGPVEVVSSSANPHRVALREAVAADGNATYRQDLPNLAAFFAAHDLQVGAGGGATWERCRVGVPALVLACADNQTVVTAALRAAEAALTLEGFDPAAIGDALDKLLEDAPLRARLAANAAALVDGCGARRVALTMLGDGLTLRPATIDDADRMHRWRNDPAVRTTSRRSGDIPYAAHLGWLQAALADPDGKRLFIGVVGIVPVGVVRFDRAGDGRFEVSIYLDPLLNGFGLGAFLLAAGERAIAVREGRAVWIVAETLPDNAASRRMFERAGYLGHETRLTKMVVPAVAKTVGAGK